MENKQDYIERMEATLKRYAQDIAGLEGAARAVETDSGPRPANRMEDLKIKQRAARDRLAEIRAASFPAWVDMKAGLEMAIAVLSESYDRARSQFKQS